MPTSSKFRWTKNSESKLIEFYKAHEVLWNPKHPEYYSRHLRDILLTRLAAELSVDLGETLNAQDMKQKIKNLRTSYQRVKKKYEASLKSDDGSASVHSPVWHHYHTLEFLNDVISVEESNDSLNNSQAQASFSDDSSSVLSNNDDIVENQPLFYPIPVKVELSDEIQSPMADTLVPVRINNRNNNEKQMSVQTLNHSTKLVEHSGDTNSIEDGVDLFFKSVAWSVKKFPFTIQEEIKVDVQKLILQYVKQYNFDH